MLLDECEADGAVGAYTVVAVMTGCRPEELRALTWSHVNLADGVIAVWKSDRHGGRHQDIQVTADTGHTAGHGPCRRC